MPGVEALLDSFRAAHTQVLGVSVDSVFSHANWGRDLGGVSFPLLADFHPKGEVARAYGLMLEDKGITDRATVLIDADGIVQHASSVTPAGARDIADLVELCRKHDAAFAGKTEDFAAAPGVSGTLYVKSDCGFSRAASLARENLHLQGDVSLLNVNQDAGAREALIEAAGKDQCPCLVSGDAVYQESAEIIAHFAERAAPL